MTHRSIPFGQRGTTLIEALLALVVTAFTALGAVQLQGEIRRHADVVRQRAEAVRLAGAELERMRAFASVRAASGVPSYDGIADAASTVDAVSGHRSNTSYRLRTTVAVLANGEAKALRVVAAWTDPRSGGEAVELVSAVAALGPAVGASLALGDGAGRASGAHGRGHAVPAEAVDLGDGTSAWKPTADATVAIRVANGPTTATAATPAIQLCDGLAPRASTRSLTAAQLVHCRPTFAGTALVRGTVRFSDASPPDPAGPADPPLDTAVRLVLLGGGHLGAPTCWSERIGTGPERHVGYACLVVPRADGLWSARAELVPAGWTIGTTATDRRVCRFAVDRDASGAVDAASEHPRDWVDARGSLVHQNFLVVRGGERCPAGRGSTDPWHTEAHQP